MKSKTYSFRLLLAFLLVSTGFQTKVHAQLQLTKSASNVSSGGNGAIGVQGQTLKYTIVAHNASASAVFATTLYDNIPAGASYVSASTVVNGASVADVNGKMPFIGYGGLINSASAATGVLAPNATVVVSYNVKVQANAGTLVNYATLRGRDSSGIVATNSNAVSTAIINDPLCGVVFSTTGTTPTSTIYNVVRSIDTLTGRVGAAIYYNGTTDACYSAITGLTLPAGSLLQNAAALAFDKSQNRLYFVNNTSNDTVGLCYIDLNRTTPAAYRYEGYPLSTGVAINRMGFAADGNGYALTGNSQDLIRFSVNPATNIPTIQHLGVLINDVSNGTRTVLTEDGGDIVGDGSGKLLLVANSGAMYRIDPATKITTYLGTVSPFPGITYAMAAASSGSLYLGGAYTNVYKANPATLAVTRISSTSTSIYFSGDYASCAFPVLTPLLKVTKTYSKIGNNSNPLVGDTLEYTITVTDTGNIAASGVKLYDSVPQNSTYFTNSTTVNGVAVADAANGMPFFVPGGNYINSINAAAGLVLAGDTGKVVIKFLVVANPKQKVCNQALVTFTDANNETALVYSDLACYTPDTTVAQPVKLVATTTSAVANMIAAQVRPNPFHSELTVQLQLQTAAIVNIRLIDLYGRSVYATSEKLGAGVNSLHVNVPAGLSAGVYMLDVLAGNNRILQHKLLKQ